MEGIGGRGVERGRFRGWGHGGGRRGRDCSTDERSSFFRIPGCFNFSPETGFFVSLLLLLLLLF